MFKFAAVYNSGRKDKHVPENWDEVTFEQYADYVDLGPNPDIMQVISVFSSIPVEDLMELEYHVIQRLTMAVRFAFNFTELDALIGTPHKLAYWKNPKTGKTEPWELGTQPFKHIIAVDNYSKELELQGKKFNSFHLCKELMKQYLDEDITGKKIKEVLKECTFFLSRYLFLKNASKN